MSSRRCWPVSPRSLLCSYKVATPGPGQKKRLGADQQAAREHNVGPLVWAMQINNILTAAEHARARPVPTGAGKGECEVRRRSSGSIVAIGTFLFACAATPVWADETFLCDDGSSVTLDHSNRDA